MPQLHQLQFTQYASTCSLSPTTSFIQGHSVRTTLELATKGKSVIPMAVSILNLDILLIVDFVAFQNIALKFFLAYSVSEHPLKYI